VALRPVDEDDVLMVVIISTRVYLIASLLKSAISVHDFISHCHWLALWNKVVYWNRT